MAIRLRTAGELQRLDLTPALDLLPALWDEWADLSFGPDGGLVNPLTQVPVPALTLVTGVHRRSGATYRVEIRTPRYDVPEERKAEFERQAKRLARWGASQRRWQEHHEQAHAAREVVGHDVEELTVTLAEDTPSRFAGTVASAARAWSVDVVVDRRRLPRIEARGHVDLTSLWRSEDVPGCLARLFGGTGSGTAVVDLGALERSGRLVDGDGRANRFAGDARIEVEATGSRWSIDGRGSLRGRGLARPVLWFTRGKIRRAVESDLAERWASSEQAMADLAADLHRLRDDVAAEGGPAPFVHRALWDDTFPPSAPI